MASRVDRAFTQALPKVELHAHLTGSISPQCLHQVWQEKRSAAQLTTQLSDPLLTIRPEGVHHDIINFFTLFDTYIYALCNDERTIRFCTKEVLETFEADGVCYLELRTTPREALDTGLTKDAYICSVLDAIAGHDRDKMSTFLILSIDRRNTYEQAMYVIDLAIKYRDRGVVGVDLCGNPAKGDVRIYEDSFRRAKSNGLRITLHFAEIKQSSSLEELRTLLSYEPDRIGHVINVPPEVATEIENRRLALELCLSCNVHAKMTSGGFSNHHFGKWHQTSCPIALSTDDVGVFGSSLSNEYLLAAEHFHLNRKDLIMLSKGAAATIFGGPQEHRRIERILESFQQQVEC